MKKTSAIERFLESALFASRWLMAPFYAGLVIAVAVLLIVFVHEILVELPVLLMLDEAAVILWVLNLIDLSLAANLLLMVIFAGYENFVSKMDIEGHPDRPSWMGTIDFSALKLKLLSSIVAISAIQLLKQFMEIKKVLATPGGERELFWYVDRRLRGMTPEAAHAESRMAQHEARKQAAAAAPAEQAVADAVDPLVVVARGRDDLDGDGVRDHAPRLDRDRMQVLLAARRLPVIAEPPLVGEVAEQRPTEGHVHDLHATTDAQRRHPPAIGFLEERELEVVAQRQLATHVDGQERAGVHPQGRLTVEQDFVPQSRIGDKEHLAPLQSPDVDKWAKP